MAKRAKTNEVMRIQNKRTTQCQSKGDKRKRKEHDGNMTKEKTREPTENQRTAKDKQLKAVESQRNRIEKSPQGETENETQTCYTPTRRNTNENQSRAKAKCLEITAGTAVNRYLTHDPVSDT